MDWSKGYSASYYMTIVDPNTWRDVGRVELLNGSISRKTSGLRQSADVTCTSFPESVERWVRIWLDASQSGGTAHEALFTGLTSVSESNLNGSLSTFPLACYSVLKPASDIPMQKGSYYPADTLASDAIRDLLSVTPAPLFVSGTTPRLAQTIVAEGKETRLSMTEKILSAINWIMQILGDGTIVISPMSESETAVFGLANDVITPKVNLKADWFDCPNVFRATYGDVTVVVSDEDPNSPLSTVNRGREVWKTEDNVKLGTDEGIQQYAARRLKEEQSYAYTVSYTRRFDPAVNICDIVRLHYPGQGLMGKYIVTSQNIRLAPGANVSEKVQK